MTTPAPTPVTTARAAPGIRTLLTRSAVAVVGLGLFFLILGQLCAPARLLGLVLAPAAAGYALYALLYLTRALVEFGGGTYRVREAASEVRFTIDDVDLVVPVDELAIPGQSSPALVVVGRTPRRRLAEINGASFGTAALEALASDLKDRGARLDHLTGRVTPAEFDRRHPGVLGLAARHPLGLQVAIGAALLVLAVVSAFVA
jgi:hypothetical protein